MSELPWKNEPEDYELTERMMIALVGIFRQKSPIQRYYPVDGPRKGPGNWATSRREQFRVRSNSDTLRVLGVKVASSTHRALARRGLVHMGCLTETGREEAKALSAAITLKRLAEGQT